MKKIVLMMLLLLPLGAWAQDVIVRKDGSTVVCRVEKVSDTDVTYKLWNDLKGSSYIIDKSLVSAINYENGTKTIFDDVTETAQAKSAKPMTDDELVKILNEEEAVRTVKRARRKEKLYKRMFGTYLYNRKFGKKK